MNQLFYGDNLESSSALLRTYFDKRPLPMSASS